MYRAPKDGYELVKWLKYAIAWRLRCCEVLQAGVLRPRVPTAWVQLAHSVVGCSGCELTAWRGVFVPAEKM